MPPYTLRHCLLIAGLAVLSLLTSGCATTREQPGATAAVAAADESQPPKTVLWVGNSFFYYNNSMHGHVGRMLSDAKVQGARATSATISGSGMDWHDMAAHFKPESGMGKYSFNSKNEVVFNKEGRRFDAVIMMDCSQCPIHPTLKPVFYETVKKHIATVRSNGAVPYLFASWAYADQPQMTEQLAAEYINAAKINSAKVIPAGYAFAHALKSRPNLNLYADDKRHPSLEGTYLAAATVLASVYKVNPTTISYTAGLPTEVAVYLRQVAWDTVNSFKP